ncbi:MAG: hypothetical protein ABMA25_18670 [Ilumatobacteraceae bacterium]
MAAAQRRAGVVAAVAGLALAPYFWLSTALVGWPVQDAPPFDAPAQDFIDFYVNGSSRIPLRATVAIGSWALWLLLILSVVRAACRRLDLAAVFSMTLAGAATAVYVAAEGLLAWPTIGTTANDISQHLDPGVAQAMVISRDGLHAAASVLLGISMLVVAWLLARSDLWGRWLLAAVASLAGVSACTTMFQGSDPIGPGGILLWGIVVAVVVLVGRRRDVSQGQRPHST